ncbi:hypothetical protein GFK26_11310 [Variovorax paradoxus]|uniref:Meckel syndrome type 1 protein n=1 Tax=Variovorax paradoxus TaxID=34073 RepID=A0A5Q0M245_VARPD|nr:hypothetical protein [Variovorax paradoxus]QFZ83308.1 hypothetical protein GFK26_11310 [Variovorax paradoxus]
MSTGMDDDLHDPRLRRALDHAPDRDAMPAAHTREAILKMAHNLAAVSAPAAGHVAEAAPWWRRLFGGGSPRSRMPWNAAFATVLVATFVTVLWHREPVPEAGLDGEAQVAGAPAPASAPPAQTAEAPAAAPAAEPAATADMTPPAAPRSDAARDAKETSKQRETQEARDASRRREAPPAAEASIQKDEERMLEKAAPAAPVVPAPAPAAPAIASAPMPAPPMADVGQSPAPYAAAPPAPAAAPAAPMQRESAETTSSLAAQGGASANVAGMQRRAAPASAPAAAKAAAPRAAAEAVTSSGFTALDRWTTLDITRAGTTTRQTRGDTEGLAALVNTVARAATVSGGELGAPVEARIELRRDGALLAVLEIAGDQVRWTPQPGGPASIGTPPAQALDALRTAVSRTR